MRKQVALFLSIVLVLLLLVAGCASKEAGEEFRSEITYSGSSTLAPLISAIAMEFMDENGRWDKVDPEFPQEDISILVSAGGSSAGVKAALEGSSDFGMLAREIKDEEKEKLENYQTFHLGMDALTISINPENPLNELKDNLSTEEIAKIFSGEYKYWDELDSSLEHREIVVLTRDLGGGAHEVFQKTIMGDLEVRKDAIQAPSMGALVTKLMENKDAIGYASFGMVNQNKGKVIPLKVDDIEATRENILSGSYKIARPLIIIKKGELNKKEKIFMDVVTSAESAKIIEELGFVAAK